MSVFEAYLFDVDGTLADTEDGHLVAFNRAFVDAGLSWNWSRELYLELLSVTGGKERMRHYLEIYDPPFEAKTTDLLDYFASLHAAKTEHYKKLVADGGVALRPGVERLLNEARQKNIRLAIATTTTIHNVTALLENTLGAASIDWFEIIAAGDVVPKKKPAPDIYDFTMNEMNLEPAQCLAFEDSGNGILSSKAANLKTLITVNPFTTGHDFTEAELIVSDLGTPTMPMQVIGGSYQKQFAGIELIDVESLNLLR